MTQKLPAWQQTAASAAGTVLLILGILVAIIELCGFDPGYYIAEYAKNDTAAYVGVSEETLDEATEVLLEYLQDKRDSLDLQAEVSGEEREFYNEREKLHMADVRDLNLGAVTFMWTALVCGGALTALAYVYFRPRWHAAKASFFAVLGVLGAFFLLGIFAAADFTSFWVGFHHVFFTNDLWTFDPRTSLLIRMFEEQFFFDLVARILIWFLSICAAILVAAFLFWRSGRRKESV